MLKAALSSSLFFFEVSVLSGEFFDDFFGISDGSVQRFLGGVQVFVQVIVGSGLIFDSVVNLILEGLYGVVMLFGSGSEIFISLLSFFSQIFDDVSQSFF